MTLYDFRNLLTDDSQLVDIYDYADEDSDPTLVFSGEFTELPDEYEDYDIVAIDSVYPDHSFNGHLGLCINTAE